MRFLSSFLFRIMVTFWMCQMFFIAGMFGANSQSNMYSRYCENFEFYDHKTRLLKLKKRFFKPSILFSCYMLEEEK